MKYGFIFADDMEYSPFLEVALENGGEQAEGLPLDAVKLKRGGNEIIAVHSGIGKVNSAFAAMMLIKDFNVDYVMSAGLSGAVSGLSRGDVVAGEAYIECDFDLRVFGYSLGRKPDGQYIMQASSELLKAAKTISGMKTGILGTGDFFLNDKVKKEEYSREFHINAFDMESAAIASVCQKLDTPFMSVRKISDDADDSAAESYTALNNLAEKALSEILLAVVDAMA